MGILTDNILKSLRDGQIADFCKGEKIDMTHGSSWGTDRTISSDFILKLCTDPDIVKDLTPTGIRIRGYRIDNELKLARLNIPFDVSMRECFIFHHIDLSHSSVPALDLSGSRTARIDADCLTVSGNLRLADGFRSEGPVCLREATIKGDLSCTGGHFDNLSDVNETTEITGCGDCRASMLHSYALVFDRATIDGSVYLCGGFSSIGGVHLGDTTIGVNLNCTKGKFIARTLEVNCTGKTNGRRLACEGDAKHHLACAFNGEGIHVKGNLIMNGIVVRGETRLTGALIEGDLDSAAGKYCHQGANAIHADRLRVKGNIFFCDGFDAKGVVRLPRAEIGSDLSFFKAQLANSTKDSYALFCKGVRVKGTIYLKKSKVKFGYVDLSNSLIGGNLDCSDSSLLNPDGWALKAKGMDVKGSVYLNSSNEGIFKAEGLVGLTGSKLGMNLICTNAQIKAERATAINNNSHYALMANNMTIDGKVEMDGKDFCVNGGVSLDDSSIASYLDCNQCTIKAPPPREKENFAISAGKLHVGGSIYLGEGFKAEGEVMLNDASTGRNLNLTSGSIINGGGYTLRAMQIKVAGSINMGGFTSHGEVKMDYATIGGNLNCSKGEFVNCQEKGSGCESSCRDGKHYALRADGAKIVGCVQFNDAFHVEGIVSLQNAEIGMRFYWMNIKDPASAALYLDAAKVGVLEDEERSWPGKGKLQINDFEYRFLKELSPEGIKSRREIWLKLPHDFRTQPFEHLAAVLKRSGYEEEAKEVLIEKNREQTRLPVRWPWSKWLDQRCPRKDGYHQNQRFIAWLLRFIFEKLVRYGYKPSHALWYGLAFIALGCVLFWKGFNSSVMVPTKYKDSNCSSYIYQIAKVETNWRFNNYSGCLTSDKNKLKTIEDNLGFYSFVYSLDTFLPVVDLQAAEYWLPVAYPPPENNLNGFGLFLCLYRWFLIISGWVISICYGAALSGIARK